MKTNSGAALRQPAPEAAKVEVPTESEERSASIAALATLPGVTAARSLCYLAADSELRVGELFRALEAQMVAMRDGDMSCLKDILLSRLFVLQALAETCARRFGHAVHPEAARVYGDLLLRSENQIAKTAALLGCAPIGPGSVDPTPSTRANELLPAGQAK